jgi:hypothetical protein
MKVFISWSGERSKAIATVLWDWLPQVIQEIEPWMSAHDIPQGSLWRSELFAQLADVQFAVICLTPENLAAPWLHFEAGAAAKELFKNEKGAVCTYLLTVTHAGVKGPLADLQHTVADEESTRKLMTDINKLADKPLPKPLLKRAFDQNWPTLRDAIEEIGNRTYEESKSPKRTDRDILEEILELVRLRGSSLSPTSMDNVLAGIMAGGRDLKLPGEWGTGRYNEGRRRQLEELEGKLLDEEHRRVQQLMEDLRRRRQLEEVERRRREVEKLMTQSPSTPGDG